MTPAERAVIEAARAYLAESGVHEGTRGRVLLVKAVRALDAESAPDAGKPYPWGEVVTTDLVLSEKLDRWFEVLETDRRGNVVQVRMKGQSKPYLRPATELVQVRRSAMGDAVDIVAHIMHSGPNGHREE